MKPTTGETADEQAGISEIRRYQRLNIAVEATQGLFWEADFATGQLHYDRSALPRLGLEDDSLLYTFQGWNSRTHPDDQAITQAEREKWYQQDKPFRFEYRISNRAGEYQWILSTGQVVERANDGTPLLAVGMAININARKVAEAALQESELLHRSIVQDQTEFITRYCLDGTFIYVNEVFAKFIGKGTDELVGLKWQNFADPAVVKRVGQLTKNGCQQLIQILSPPAVL